MSVTTLRRTTRRFLRRHANSGAAVLSNGIAAGSSFALQLVAARTLGAAGLGRFSLLTSILITVTAVQSGWIGDSLTVLDRFAPPIRAALLRSQQAAAVLALLIGGGLAATRVVSSGVALLFGAALALWLLEDSGRRVLMARREFWHSVLNDSIYAVVALGTLAAHVLAGHEVTLGALLWAMAAGSGAACVAAVVQLPRHELTAPPPGTTADLAGLSSFAGWRAAQIGLRPGAQFFMRAMVAAVFSSAALGRLEAARLLLAPMLVVINGAGFFLLPTYTDRLRRGTLSLASVRRAMVILGGLSLVGGACALASSAWLSPLLTRGAFDVSPVAVVSWTALAVGFGAGIPAGLALVATGRPRETFLIRAADSAAGLVIGLAFVVVGAPELTPAGLAVGAFLGAAWLLRALREALASPPPAR